MSVSSSSSTSTDLILNSNTNNNDELQPHNQDDINLVFESSHRTEENIIEKLSLTAQQRIELEEQTRSQSSTNLWFEVRRQQLTGSICGRVLNQKAKTVQLLRYCVYPKPMLYLPKPIAWGVNNERKACRAYVQHIQILGHPGLQGKKAGFVEGMVRCLS